MSYTDAVFKQLISIKSGEDSTRINFIFSISSFHGDWLSEKSRNWKDVLIQLNQMVDNLIEEFEESKNYSFTTLSDYNATNPEGIIQKADSTIYPKICDDFHDFVFHNQEEESIWRRNENHDFIIAPLKSLNDTILACIIEYEIYKDSAIYNPSYKYYDRIPFNGNERALSAFTNLLIQGGFIICKENVPDHLMPDEGEARAIFKKHVIQKKELAERLSKLFYTVGSTKFTDESSEKISLKEPNKNNLKSKMQVNYMKELSEKEKKKFYDGFDHIQNQIKSNF